MMPTLADRDRLIVNKLIYQTNEPQRGDIVMLRYPLDPDKTFVRRLVALEGDQVHLPGGRLLVNNVPMDEPFIPESFRGHRDWGPGVVPQGYYFVLGDHRNNSSDSRHWGFVPKKYVLGRAQWRWWPASAVRAF
jgi:signal peptidase I